MGIQDTAESLLGKSKRRRERHDLQQLGVKLGAAWTSHRNEELAQRNERFHNSDEALWQQQINQEDAITDSQWFLNERVTGRETQEDS